MKCKLCFLGAFLAALILISPSFVRADGPDKLVFDKGIVQEGMQVAPRGPIHEAFAQPLSLNPEPGPLVAKQPPPLVPELPPEQKPEGDNVQWIPGYWAWDSEKNDYLWVSGVYRNMPPGRKYIPGYWAQTDDGFRWVAGYFTPAQQAEIPLVPQPPASLDNGPSIPAPDDNSFYTPGIWVYNGTEFVWRPGFWSPYRQGWVWIPSCYQWTPGGYAFVNGYWDYSLADRGLLFAPMYFNDPLWQTPGWYYRPRLLLGIADLLSYLWCRPGYPCYFYGNYWGPGFAGLGFNPWFGGPWWGNPLFNYYRWHNRGNPTWVAGMRNNFNRPGNRAVAFTPLNQVRSGLVNVSATQLNVQRNNIQQFRQIAQTRNRLETAAAKQGNAVKTLNLTTGKTTITPARFNSLGANNVKSSNFSKGTSFTPKTGNTGTVSKQALTGQSNFRVQNNNLNVNKNNFNNLNVNKNNYKGTTSYQAKTGITGSQRQGTNPSFNYYPKTTANSYRSSTGSTYRPATTQSYRPTTTYRPSTSYRPSSSGYRGSSAGSRGSSGSRGGGSRGGGGRR
jgi:hypothetical protein